MNVVKELDRLREKLDEVVAAVDTLQLADADNLSSVLAKTRTDASEAKSAALEAGASLQKVAGWVDTLTAQVQDKLVNTQCDIDAVYKGLDQFAEDAVQRVVPKVMDLALQDLQHVDMRVSVAARGIDRLRGRTVRQALAIKRLHDAVAELQRPGWLRRLWRWVWGGK